MEIPIYLTFKEFEENYPEDLKKWLKHYEDSEEIEFWEEVEEKYKRILKNGNIEVRKEGEEKLTLEKEEISLITLFGLISIRLKYFIENENIKVKNEREYLHLIVEVLNYNPFEGFKIYDKKKPNKIFYKDNYIIEDYIIKEYYDFIQIIKPREYYFLFVDEIKFKNFQFAKKRIYEFIEQRRKELTEEQIESHTQEGRNKSDIIAVLHHIGIIDFLRDKYPNATQRGIARFFEFVTNGYITERSNHSQFTSDKESTKYPKNLKSEINNLLKDYFADANA